MQTEDIKQSVQFKELNDYRDQAAVKPRSLTWSQIGALVNEVAGLWGNRYNELRGYELEKCYDLTKEERLKHLSEIELMIDLGSSILLTIHNVENDSNPPQDLTAVDQSMTAALMALKISKSAFSQSVEEIELSNFNV